MKTTEEKLEELLDESFSHFEYLDDMAEVVGLEAVAMNAVEKLKAYSDSLSAIRAELEKGK